MIKKLLLLFYFIYKIELCSLVNFGHMSYINLKFYQIMKSYFSKINMVIIYTYFIKILIEKRNMLNPKFLFLYK